MVLSTEDLNIELASLLDRLAISPYSYDLPFFETLYDFGFRLGEMFLLYTSVVDQNNLVACATLKGNPYRFIPLSMFSESIVKSIVRKENYYFFHRPDHYHDVFNKFCTYKNIYIGNKEKTVHLFRHNRAKQIFIDTQSVQAVMNFLGVTNRETALNYINSEIVVRD